MRGRSLAAALLASPLVLLALPLGVGPQFLTIVVVLVLAALVGARAWPSLTRPRAALLALATLAAFVGAAALIFPLNGLCGPESDAVLAGGRAAGLATYAAVALRALARPFAWPLAALAGAVAFDVVMGVALAAGVRWSC